MIEFAIDTNSSLTRCLLSDIIPALEAGESQKTRLALRKKSTDGGYSVQGAYDGYAVRVRGLKWRSGFGADAIFETAPFTLTTTGVFEGEVSFNTLGVADLLAEPPRGTKQIILEVEATGHGEVVKWQFEASLSGSGQAANAPRVTSPEAWLQERSVLFDREQSLTSAQQERGRLNLGLANVATDEELAASLAGLDLNLSGKITSETTRATTSENAIEQNLNAETLARSTAVSEAEARERSRAMDAEMILSNDLSTETAARQLADDALTNSLSDKLSRTNGGIVSGQTQFTAPLAVLGAPTQPTHVARLADLGARSFRYSMTVAAGATATLELTPAMLGMSESGGKGYMSELTIGMYSDSTTASYIKCDFNSWLPSPTQFASSAGCIERARKNSWLNPFALPTLSGDSSKLLIPWTNNHSAPLTISVAVRTFE